MAYNWTSENGFSIEIPFSPIDGIIINAEPAEAEEETPIHYKENGQWVKKVKLIRCELYSDPAKKGEINVRYVDQLRNRHTIKFLMSNYRAHFFRHEIKTEIEKPF